MAVAPAAHSPSTMYEALEQECIEGARNPAEAVDRVMKRYGADWCRDTVAMDWTNYAYGDAVRAFNVVATRAQTDASSLRLVTSIGRPRRGRPVVTPRKPGGLLETIIAVPVGDGKGFEYVRLADMTAQQCEARSTYYKQFARTLTEKASMWHSWAVELKKKKVAKIGDLGLTDEELMALAES